MLAFILPIPLVLLLAALTPALASAADSHASLMSKNQLYAERRELEAVCSQDKHQAIEMINSTIAKTSADPTRQAMLYLLKADCLQHDGPAFIEDNVAQAVQLFDKNTHPDMHIFAMTLQAYTMSTYNNQTEDARLLLESLQQHPALQQDVYLSALFFSTLLQIYYKLDEFEQISRPLFRLVKILEKHKGTPEYHYSSSKLTEELANHSGLIGDVEQASRGYLQLVEEMKLKNETDNVAALYCNLASPYYLPFAEKVAFAKASLAERQDIGCSDLMQKIVLLDEIKHGNLQNLERLSEFSPHQVMPTLNEKSAYYAGLAYLHLQDSSAALTMAQRINKADSWQYQDLMRQIYQQRGEYDKAYAALEQYQQLREQIDTKTRQLTLNSYQTRLELEQEDTREAQREQVAALAAESRTRLLLMMTIASAAVLLSTILMMYLHRSRKQRRLLQQLSDTDPLTGLFNRRAFLQRLQTVQHLAQRQQFPLTLALIDLDLFKQINDTHGHQVGDAVLCAFAEAANATLRQSDLIGRFGGEEFIIATSHQTPNALAEVLQRLQHNFNNRCQQDKSIGITVSFSAGLSEVEPDIDSAIRQADEQMYKAKANGRQQVCSHEGCIPL